MFIKEKRLVTCVSFRSIIAIVIRHVPKHFFILILYIKFAMPKSCMGFSILISNFYHLTIWCVLSTVSDFKASFPFKSDFFLFSSHDSVMFKEVWIQKFKDGIMSHATIITFWTSSVANKFFKTKMGIFYQSFWLFDCEHSWLPPRRTYKDVSLYIFLLHWNISAHQFFPRNHNIMSCRIVFCAVDTQFT